MSATYGIAGFVSGFIDGRDTKNRWEDRKLDRKRQERFDELAIGQDKRAAEEHARRMKIYDQQIAETERAAKAADEMASVYSDSVDAANAAMDAERQQPAQGATTVPPPGATPPGVSLPLGLPAPGSKSGAAAAAMMGTPAQLMAEKQAQPPSLPATMPLGLPGKTSGIAPPEALVRAAQASPSQPDRSIVPPMGLPPNPMLQVNGPGPTGVIPQELYDKGILPRRFVQDPSAPVVPSADEARAKAAAEAEEANKRQKMILAGLAELPGTANAETRKQAAAKMAAMTPQPSKPPGVPLAAPAGPAVSKAPQAAPPASAPPLVKALSSTAMQAMASTATPAMQAASQSASKGLPPPPKGEAQTNAAREKYAKGFMDHYLEKGAPMVVEAFIKNGQFDKAIAFQEFMQRQQTKAGMDDWAKAAFAASVGDMDTFSKHIMSAYNRLDYFGDDTTIVEAESGFTRDKAGNITGAKITFKDEKTGNTFDQVFTNPNDLVRMGITLLAPEQAFEFYHQQQQAAVNAAMGLTPKEAAEAAAKEKTETAKRIDDIAKTIYEGSKQLDGTYAMTYEEARRAAMQAVQAPESAPTAPPPVVYRP